VVLPATCAPRRPLAYLRACACPCAILPPRLPAVPRLSPPGYPGDAPRTSPARWPTGAGSGTQRRCGVQVVGAPAGRSRRHRRKNTV